MKKVTVDQVHEFMKLHYKADRFEGRNNADWGKDYSMNLAHYYCSSSFSRFHLLLI
ncbi:hypothetical protein [Providencia sp. MGF014]|uniref:hypothetical protein n=1 Tax=Providencia sp. MGF014 TaxID=2565573 RepID=UPI0014463809|nr:hypothetical protein [Providencia sp. MGF014]